MEFVLLFLIHLAVYWPSSIVLFDPAAQRLRPDVPYDEVIRTTVNTQLYFVLPSLFLYSWMGSAVILFEKLWFIKMTLFYFFHEVVLHLVHKHVLHGPLWYVHKTRHTSRWPVPMAALSAHWADVAVSFVLPVLAGPLLLGASAWIMRFWIAWATAIHVCAHAPVLSLHHAMHYFEPSTRFGYFT